MNKYNELTFISVTLIEGGLYWAVLSGQGSKKGYHADESDMGLFVKSPNISRNSEIRVAFVLHFALSWKALLQ
jgi:hypothetical protein